MPDNSINDKKQYYCSECGTEVSDLDLICPNCGADLSQVIEENPDEPVVLETVSRQKDADYVIEQLAANQINATKPLTGWSETQSIQVLVRRGDLGKAKEVLSLIRRRLKTMFLADIFSSTFTTAGKTIINNLIICSLFIPAGLLAAFFINTFFSSFYVSHPDINTAYVYVEEADTMDITREYTANGWINSNRDAVVEVTGLDTNFVHTGDTVRVHLDEDNYESYESSIVSIEQVKNFPFSNNSSSEKHKLTIKLFEPDKHIIEGKHCEAEIKGETRTNVLGTDIYSVNFADDSFSAGLAGTDDYVYVLKNNKVFKTNVKTGIFGDGYIEVISGLSAGDSVVYDTSSMGRSLSDGVKASAEIPEDEVRLKDIPLNVFLLLLGIVLIVLANLAVTIGVTKSAALYMEGIKTSVKQIFSTIFSLAYLRSIGIWGMITAVAGFPFFIVLFFVIIIAAQQNNLLTGLSAIMFLPAAGFAVFIYIKWGFAAVHTIITSAPILDSVAKSSSLVKGTWWRTFGIIMLTSLVVSFVVSLISTPVSFIFMWDYISTSMHSAAMGNAEQDLKSVVNMYRSMGWGLPLTTVFTYILQCLIAPIFAVVMYYDLKIRKNDYFIKLNEEDLNKPEPAAGNPAI
jgi:hypothetical protein